MKAEQAISVLDRVMRPRGAAMAPEAAQEFLRWELSPQDDARIDELSAKNKRGPLTNEEEQELAELCNAVDFVSLLHLYAREAIGDLPKAGD